LKTDNTGYKQTIVFNILEKTRNNIRTKKEKTLIFQAYMSKNNLLLNKVDGLLKKGGVIGEP